MEVNQTKIKKQFGKHLRKLRKEKGWTQEELAEKANMHFTYIGQIERGIRNPSLVNLYKLSKALKIHLGNLFSFRP
jgi:transcriptional regulator with XRE-family HTH domain